MFKEWVVEALKELGGTGSILEISKYVWRHHEEDLREAGDVFYTWQYDIRWAGQQLRDAGVLRAVHGGRGLPWELARREV
jgi:hypothetical protein